MQISMRSRLCALLAGVALLAPLLGAPAARAAAAWQSGPLVESQDLNCITGEVEQEAGAYMSYYFDAAHPPVEGETYYVAVNAIAIGNTCPGIYAALELAPGSGSEVAIDAGHPVECFLQFPGQSVGVAAANAIIEAPVECFLQFPGQSSYVRDTAECPQSLAPGLHGLSLNPTANPYFWPLPQGGTVEVNVPVRSTAGVHQLTTTVQLADGQSDPVLAPSITTIVSSHAQEEHNEALSISYNEPPVVEQLAEHSGESPIKVLLRGYIWNHNASGTAWLELTFPGAPGGSPSDNCSTPWSGNYLTVAYPYKSGPAALKSPDTLIETAPFLTGLYPGTPYCWRLAAKVGSNTYYGNWQFFNTIGNPLAPAKKPPFSAAAPSTGTGNCSSSGGGCHTSSCETGGSCSACASGCLTSFAPKLVPTPATPAAKPSAPPPSATTPSAPVLSGLKESARRWRVGRKLPAIASRGGLPVGTDFSFTLSGSATVTFSFEHSVSGKLLGGRCKTRSGRGRHRRSCRLSVADGSFSIAAHAGEDQVAFQGRISAAKRLKPGRYSVSVVATDTAGRASSAQTLTFTIAK